MVEKPFHKFWPEDVPKEITIPPITLDAMLRETAKKFPGNTATTYYGVPLSYQKLDEISDRIAAALAKLGVRKGDTVAIHGTNTPPVVAAYYGAMRAGAIVTLLSPLFKPLEIKFQLADSDAKVAIKWEGFDGLYENVRMDQTKVEHVITSSLGNWFSPDPVSGPLLGPLIVTTFKNSASA